MFSQFQSTHSLRSATGLLYHWRTIKKVSIHALLAECDISSFTRSSSFKSFNPRTPCGVRPENRVDENLTIVFQSTHSLRSATTDAITYSVYEDVSIHALLAECDQGPMMDPKGVTSFNPRTPCGVRPIEITKKMITILVSIHALLAECDPFR